jgi:hypothetical protein
MNCDREFLVGAIAAGPVWLLIFVAFLAAFWLVTERLHRRRERNERFSAHLHNLLKRNEPPHE